ncbi:MAG: AraC family transcriptional regulator [Saprospiraceae bacterium]|nr:AraC family transcriptional regulator [Saprospiraceae bacterium]
MNFAINLRSILLLLAMVQGLVIAGLLLHRGIRRRQLRDVILSGLLLALVTSLISFFIGFMGVYDYAAEQGWDLTYFPFGNGYLLGPLIWLYVLAVTDRQFQWRPKTWGHFFLPALYYAVSFYMWSLPPAQKEAFGAPWVSIFDEALLATSLGIYLFLSLKRYAAYRRLLQSEYSNTDRLTLDWLRNFLYVFAAYYLASLIFNLVNLWIDLWYTGWYWLELTRAILLYYISVTGWAFVQKVVVSFDDLEQREVKMTETGTAGSAGGKVLFTPGELVARREKLAAFMSERRPWLDPDLTLSELAAQTGMNVSQLSYLVNAGFDKNFNDFINAYRVEAVKEKMNDPDAAHLSLLGVAFECGFNSKATFNRAFKKATGQSPSEYLSKA